MTPQETQARQMVEALLCLDLTPATAQARTFKAREGMRTVFTGLFSNVSSVTVNGKAVTNYYPAFFDKRNGTLFNSLVFTEPVCGEVVVTGDWSATTLPADLQRLVDNALAVVNQTYSTKEVKSKRVEDFQITYSDLSDDEVFLKQNAVTINKYSMCHIDYILHGDTCGHSVRCFC
jgi:hypothetical protein